MKVMMWRQIKSAESAPVNASSSVANRMAAVLMVESPSLNMNQHSKYRNRFGYDAAVFMEK